MTDSPARIERDTFGPIEVPAAQLWGAQTQRSLQFFRISSEKLPTELIRALLLVKRAAAKVNEALGLLAPNMINSAKRASPSVIRNRVIQELRRRLVIYDRI